jgi:hypothetical protein
MLGNTERKSLQFLNAEKDLWECAGDRKSLLQNLLSRPDFISGLPFAISSNLLSSINQCYSCDQTLVLSPFSSVFIRYGFHVIYRPVPQDEIDNNGGL